MEPFKIDNAKERFFTSKEDYLNFKQAWKDFHNNKENLVWYEDVEVTSWEERFRAIQQKREPIREYARAKTTALGAEHYLLYNLLRGYDTHRGFNPLTNEGRIYADLYPINQPRPWRAVENAARHIAHIVRQMDLGENTTAVHRDRIEKQVDVLLKPFGGTLSRNDLSTIGKLLGDHLYPNKEGSEVGIGISQKTTANIIPEEAENVSKDNRRSFWSRILGR